MQRVIWPPKTTSQNLTVILQQVYTVASVALLLVNILPCSQTFHRCAVDCSFPVVRTFIQLHTLATDIKVDQKDGFHLSVPYYLTLILINSYLTYKMPCYNFTTGEFIHLFHTSLLIVKHHSQTLCNSLVSKKHFR